MSEASPVTPSLGRRDRRRLATRERLLEAALCVMEREGYERASIAAIAEEADLGFGTFYGYFESKEAVFQALVEAAAAARFAYLERAVAGIGDLAESLAVGTAVLIALAAKQPELTRFLLDARRPIENPGEEVVVSHLRAGVAAGCAAGRFRVPDQAAAVAAVVGAVRGIAAAVATRSLGADPAIESAAELALRLLGLDPTEAARLGGLARARAREQLA